MPRRILIVEDEELARKSLAGFLRESGYDVSAAGDGRSALDMQRQQPFDVCIVDIRMPDMDGVETILALRDISDASRFVVYTGSPQFSLPVVLQETGLSDRFVVRKPVLDMGIFLDLIDEEKSPSN